MDGSMDGRVRALFMCLHMCGWMHARACMFHAFVHVCVCMYDVCVCAWMDEWVDGWVVDGHVDGWMDARAHSCMC
jgi:hypothetical protein